MTNFTRALRLTLQYRFTLAGLLICTLMVALFWGGNIGAVYPIVKVVFEGQSLQEWIDQEIANSEQRAEELEKVIADAEQAIHGMDTAAVSAVNRELAVHRTRLRAERTALATAIWLKPKIYNYLPADPFQTIVVIVLVLLAATVAKNLFLFGNNMLLQRLVQMVTFDLRNQLYDHALKMDLSEFGEQRVGTMMSRFNIDLGYLSQGLTVLFGRAIREPLKAIVCLIGAGLVNWRLLLFSLILAPLAGFLIRLLAKSIKRANRRVMEENASLMGVLSESFSGMETIKAFTMEQYERKRFHRTSKQCLLKSMKIALYDSLSKPATEVFGLAMVFTALIAGAYLVLNNETHIMGIRMCNRPMSVAALMCFYGMLIGTSDPARKLSDVFNAVQGGVAAADRLFPLLDRQPQVADPVTPKTIPRPHKKLVFENVDFHYTADQPVLKNINLVIPFGETLCIVGPNGCGKTTLATLLPRFHDPVNGAIRLDDVDLRELSLRDLRRAVGMVSQQTLLFDDTVMHNIRYGSLHASDEQVMEAARRAHAHDFIVDKLDAGYETVVGPGGGRLSGGQRQRIALARAILRNPEILVLDEATSQIDIESEQLIHRALQDFVRNRTAIIITHRLSTLELADRILVMEAGRAVDIGTHHELLARCGVYQRLHEINLRQTA